MYLTLLYYNYVKFPESSSFAKQHLEYCKNLGLVGRIIVAEEGINGTVSGTPDTCHRYMEYIRKHPILKDTQFKIDEVETLSFTKIHVRFKNEIVNSGLLEKGIYPWEKTGVRLSPQEFETLKDSEDIVVLDVRSNYEHKVGRFKNALTLDIDNFRDFPDKIDELTKLKDKKFLTYCTGGVKCEKASAYLLAKGFEEVYQLEGGIIKYAKETGGKDFDGKCYVFDNRVVVDVNTVNPKEVGKCLNCGVASSKMINCANPECNEHFIQCENCGWKMAGCCSTTCMEHCRCRKYDGSGYYIKDLEPSKHVSLKKNR